ncbi:Dixin [Branchiostoma belcheri]|nr:Dixin [Branchiostoma belcheri]
MASENFVSSFTESRQRTPNVCCFCHTQGARHVLVKEVSQREAQPQSAVIMAEGPVPQRGSSQAESQSWAEWTEQLQAYVAWVNSQLKKRAGCRIVSDLRRDMQDGVAFAQLVEILSGETLPHVDYSPNSLGTMKQNVEIVLQFMQTHRIRMHQTSAKDIVEGNLKAVMRLILALAAYFKPSSVKSSSSSAQQQYHGRREGRYHGDVGHRRSPASTPDRQPPRYEDLVRSPPASMSPQSRPPTQEPDVLPRRDSSDTAQGLSSGDEGSRASWQDLLEQHLDLESQMEEAKDTVVKLQQLLLQGEEEGEGVRPLLEGVNPEEQVVLLQSRLDQREVECDHLRKDLSRAKQENINLHGTKVGLQSRLTEQDNSLLEMKNELLRLGFVMEQFEADKAELQRKVDEKNKMLTDLRRQLTEKDRQLDEQQAKLEEAERKLTQANSSKGKDNVSSPVYNGVPTALPPGEELQVVREALRGLRSCFQVNNPQHHTIDTLEQSIATLMERLRFLESQRLIASQKESLANRMKPASPKPQDMALSPTSRQRSNGVESNGTVQGTKILYFTEKTVTPFMTSISKKLGDITLRDFKEVFDRQGSFRFHFKALDPEFGTVKEEVCQDEDIIPGWEGKIVAWIEECDRTGETTEVYRTATRPYTTNVESYRAVNPVLSVEPNLLSCHIHERSATSQSLVQAAWKPPSRVGVIYLAGSCIWLDTGSTKRETRPMEPRPRSRCFPHHYAPLHSDKVFDVKTRTRKVPKFCSLQSRFFSLVSRLQHSGVPAAVSCVRANMALCTHAVSKQHVSTTSPLPPTCSTAGQVLLKKFRAVHVC